MAPEVKTKKRKAAAADDEVAKAKKVKQMAADVLPKKRKTTDVPDSIVAKKIKGPKPDPEEGALSMAVDNRKLTGSSNPILNGNEETPKKFKSSGNAKNHKKKLKEGQSSMDSGNDQGTVKKPGLEIETPYEEHKGESTTDESEDEEIDDQTEALLKGFESDDDISSASEDHEYKVGDEIPKVGKKIQKKSKAAEKASTSGKPGVVYIGRIPHGFYEQEMKQYFSQFGNITNLRLSRNRKTGRSKHFAFVEFESSEVAEIVSKTMDSYLLFGHILKCKLVAPEQVHKNLWTGANKRFKSVPWNKIQGRKLSQPLSVAGWEKRMEREEKRRADKKEAMKLIGYEFETPNLKSAKEVLKTQRALSKTVGDETGGGEQNTIEAAPKVHISEAQEGEDSNAVAKSTNNTVPEPSRKKEVRKAKQSNELVSKVGAAKSAPNGGVDDGLSEEVAKVKRNKKQSAA